MGRGRRAGRTGEVHYVPRPGTDRWVGMGEGEWRLLRMVQAAGPAQTRQALDIPGWSPEAVATAIARFAQLGLLDGSGPRPDRPDSVRAWVALLISAALVGMLAVQIALMVRMAPWGIWVGGRPPGWAAFMFIVLIAATHEAGHALVALAVGYPGALSVGASRMGWIPLPTVRLEQFWTLSKTARTAVVLGGPGAQLLLAAAGGTVWLVWSIVGSPPPVALSWVHATAIILAAVNLLPVYPLDGYWLLAVRLDRPRLREESRAIRIGSNAGMLALSGLLVLWVAGFML